MLLPLGVKILWFVLSLIGLAGCWIVLVALGRTIGSLWPVVLYCIGCSVLEGIFCIGMIWKMDPFSMPGRFCTAQSILIALGTFLMTGVIAVLSYITNKIVLKPKTWNAKPHDALDWKATYALPTILFPLAALASHLALVLKLGAVRPAVEFYCDSSSPQWVRFMSYAGTPLLLSVPSLILSIKSVLRVQEVKEHISRACTTELEMDPSEDTYTKPSRTLSFRHRFRRRTKEKESFDMTVDDESSSIQQPSLRFSLSPFQGGNRTSKGSTFTDPGNTPPRAGTASPANALRNSVQSVVAGTLKPTAVHFHIPAKPPSAASESQSERVGSITSTSSPASSCELPPSVSGSFHALDRINSTPSTRRATAGSIEEVGRARSASASGCESPGAQRQGRRSSGNGGPRGAPISLSHLIENTARERDPGAQWGRGGHHVTVTDTDLDTEEKGSKAKRGPIDDDESVRSDMKGHCTDNDDDSALELGEIVSEENEDDDDDTLSGLSKDRPLPKMRTHRKPFNPDTVLPATFRSKRLPMPTLSCAIWRLILFQIAFVCAQFIGSLSTLIDVAKHHPAPSPLGTHHFAILFFAWGPIFFFGPLQDVRDNMFFAHFRSPASLSSSH